MKCKICKKELTISTPREDTDEVIERDYVKPPYWRGYWAKWKKTWKCHKCFWEGKWILENNL